MSASESILTSSPENVSARSEADVALTSGWIMDSGRCAPAFNMAMDEAMLESLPRLQRSLLRFYGWNEPAATFGYFQKYAEVEQTILLRPLLRRPTGGGIVPHDADWTYSLAFPPGSEWYGLRAEESYRRVHAWLQAAFARLEVATELAPCCKVAGPGQCFVGYEKYDLLWHGRKIAGAAQRRNKLGLLIQGSVQPPPVNLQRGAWQEAMRAVAGGSWETAQPDAGLLQAAQALVAEKYSLPDYNQRR